MKKLSKFSNRVVSSVESKWRNRLLTFSEERTKKSASEIVAEGVAKGYNAEIIEQVVTYILEYIPKIDGFPINYEDDVLTDYGIDMEDLSDFYRNVFKQIGVTLPSRQQEELFLQEYGDGYTVRLVVEYIIWVVEGGGEAVN